MGKEGDFFQINLMLGYLKRHKSGITSAKAMEELGIIQAPNVIKRLRAMGHDIESVPMSGKNRFGRDVHFVRWVLKK